MISNSSSNSHDDRPALIKKGINKISLKFNILISILVIVGLVGGSILVNLSYHLDNYMTVEEAQSAINKAQLTEYSFMREIKNIETSASINSVKSKMGAILSKIDSEAFSADFEGNLLIDSLNDYEREFTLLVNAKINLFNEKESLARNTTEIVRIINKLTVTQEQHLNRYIFQIGSLRERINEQHALLMRVKEIQILTRQLISLYENFIYSAFQQQAIGNLSAKLNLLISNNKLSEQPSIYFTQLSVQITKISALISQNLPYKGNNQPSEENMATLLLESKQLNITVNDLYYLEENLLNEFQQKLQWLQGVIKKRTILLKHVNRLTVNATYVKDLSTDLLIVDSISNIEEFDRNIENISKQFVAGRKIVTTIDSLLLESDEIEILNSAIEKYKSNFNRCANLIAKVILTKLKMTGASMIVEHHISSLLEQESKNIKIANKLTYNIQEMGIIFFITLLLLYILVIRTNKELLVLTGELNRAATLAEISRETKSNFLANMSHEIRTPMNSIIGMTDLALQTTLTSEEFSYIYDANQSAKLLLGILNDILDFSRIEANKLKLETINFDLHKVINDFEVVIRNRAHEASLSLNIIIHKDVPQFLQGDPLRLYQVLLNIGSNAIKFTEKGSVQLLVSKINSPDERVGLQFSIQDSGIGMSAREMSNIFKAFTQSDSSMSRKYGGSGLGLVISKQLVELMNGDIKMNSRKGVGTTFIIEMFFHLAPTHFNTELLALKNKKIIDDTIRNIKYIARKKILLAEDNEINQRLMKSLFLKKGIEITIVENGELVLKKLKNEHFDIILMDCQMPVMDGYEATKAIRTELHMHTIPIVALTANIMLEHKQKALACGMDDIIGKPFDFDNLLSVLANLLLVGGETNTSTTVETKTEPFNQKKTTTVLVDFKKGLKTTNNIQDLFIELLTVFIKNYHPNIFSAKVSSQHQMSTLLHELKSVSASIGAIALSKRCDHYEQLNKSEHLSEAHYKELKALLQTTNAEIKSYITYHSDDNNRKKPSSQEVSH